MEALELQEKRLWLHRWSTDPARTGEGYIPSPAERQAFDPATRSGSEVYESLGDEELLAVLRQAAVRLGHSPAQREVYWAYRLYLRQRFGKWPAALRLAGLSRAAGVGGSTLAEMTGDYERTQALLERVRSTAKALGRVPHATDLPEVCAGLRSQYATWGQVLAAAGVELRRTVYPIDDLTSEDKARLAALRAQAERLNRAPLKSEADPELRAALIARCSSWRNALYQIGLEPVIHMAPFSGSRLDRSGEAPVPRHKSALYDCYYRVLVLDAEAGACLAEVSALAQQLGRAPKRGEVAPETRRRLQDVCGSWSNALFQLGLHSNK